MTLVKFRPQNNSGASHLNSVVTFSLKTDVAGDLYQKVKIR